MTDYHRSARSEYAASAFGGQAQHGPGQINRARQAAEALFAPKPRTNEPSAPIVAPSAERTARKPRILSAVQVRPTRDDATEAPVESVPPKPPQKIRALHLDRIRTWLKYGMTIAQVAEVYGVTIGDIDRMLQKA